MYHPDVQEWRGDKNKEPVDIALVPLVRAKLVNSVRILPQQCSLVTVELEGNFDAAKQLLLEPEDLGYDLQMEQTLLCPLGNNTGTYQVVVENCTGFTQDLDVGVTLGAATEVEEVLPTPIIEQKRGAHVNQIVSNENIQWRKDKLCTLLDKGESALVPNEREKLKEMLMEYHNVFSLEMNERGETDLIQFEINTGDAPPKKQPTRYIPHAARQEVARLLKEMQEANVIKPSMSPWASPVVLVQKKDGTLRFCIDYRKLNELTKADTFPLPKIDDLLDQLGKSKYFSTLDLKSGYWQIKVHPASQEKTAFTMHQGLFEFRVMPFRLMNAPAAFQRLMQQVLMGLNTESATDFVAVYLDDILIFSETFQDHMTHLRTVLQRLEQVNLKLNPKKCCFGCQMVEYLGHILTPDGLKPNPKRIAAVRQFATPHDVEAVKQFLGLASFYRKFVPNFTKIAELLHNLTRKDVQCEWTATCQHSFNCLKKRLVEGPFLVYPDFNQGFYT